MEKSNGAIETKNWQKIKNEIWTLVQVDIQF